MDKSGDILKDLEVEFPKSIYSILNKLNFVAKGLNKEIYLVGGYVRDLLLKIQSKDLDFVTPDGSLELIKELHREIGGELSINERFKTGKIVQVEGISIDIVSARLEHYKYQGYLPIISKGDLIDDLYRRDFSINTLLIDFKDIDNPKLLNFLGGFEDLKKREIRVLHDNSFMDDPTRIYRAIRLSNKLNLKIEKDTLSLLKEAISNNAVERVSNDRLFNEVKKAIYEINSYKILKKFNDLNLFRFISDSNSFNNSVIDKLAYYEEKSHVFLKQFDFGQVNDNLVKFMLLIRRVDINQLQLFLNTISIKKEVKKRILKFRQNNSEHINKLNFIDCPPYDVYRLLNGISVEEIICYIILGNFDKLMVTRIMEYFSRDRKKKILITGDDLRNLGIKEGPIYGKILERLKEEIINNKYISKQEQMNVIRKIVYDFEREGLY